MDRKDQFRTLVYGACGVVFSLFCLLYLIPVHVQNSETYTVSPASFPKIAAVVIGLSGLALVITTWLAIPDKSAVFKIAREGLKWNVLLRQAGFVVAMVIYIQLIPMVGFVIASSIFALGMLFYFGSRSLVKNALIAVIFSVAVYLLFTRLFQVGLHAGWLPF